MLVVLAPAGGEEVLERLRAWSHARVLEPLLWWEPGGESARLLKDGELGDVESVASVLATQKVDASDVRTLGFLAGGPVDHDQAHAALGDIVSRFGLLRSVLPFGKGPDQPGLLLAPATPRTRFAVEEQLGSFRPIVLVSAEDRSHPLDANFLASPSEDAIAAHVAHALVALGGAQSTPLPQTPPIVTLAADAAEQLGQIFVTRSFSRVLDLGYIVDHVASQVLRPGSGWPNPDPLQFDRKELSDEQVDGLVEGYFATYAEVLALTVVDPIRPDPPRRLGLWAALKAVARYLWNAIQNKPVEWLNTKVGGLYDSLADRLERLAPGSGIQVQRWREEGLSLGAATQRAFSSFDIHIPDGAVGPAWRDLWLLSIGLTDGSDRPEWIVPGLLRSGELKQLAADPEQLVPDPLKLPPSSKGLENVQACDPERWDPLVKSGFAAGPSDSSAELTDDDLTALREQLQGYYVPRSKSLLWKIGVRLASNKALAELESVAPAEHEWPDPAQVEAELAVKAKRYRRGFLIKSLLLTVAAVVGGTVMLTTAHPLWAKVAVWGGELLLWLVGIALLWRDTDRKEAADGREALEHYYSLVNRTILAMYRRADFVRLGRRYEEYKHWAEILGHFLHHPFVALSSRPVEPVPDVDPTTLPAAFTVGVGLVDDQEILRAAAEIQRGIFNPSWLRDYAEGVLRSVMTDLFARHGIDAELTGEPLPDPFPDVQGDAGSPRRVFLRAVKVGTHRSIDSSPLTPHFLRSLGGMQTRRFAAKVVDLRDERAQGTFGITATWVGLPTGAEALTSAVRPLVVKVLTTRSEGGGAGSGVVVGSTGLVVTNAHVVDGATSIRIELAGGQQVKAKLAQRSLTTDLAILEFAPPHQLPAARLSGSSPVQGAMVVLVGHPFAFEGEPTLTWGLISASNRSIDFGAGTINVLQTSYPAAGGASGSPVFDLNGNLVGIHVGGMKQEPDEWRGDFVSYAVPVEEVNALLASVGAAPDPTVAPLRYEPPTAEATEDLVEFEAKEFLAALDPAERPALDPTMWKLGTYEQAHVSEVLPGTVPSSESQLHETAGTLGFLRPSRVWFSRTEVTAPTDRSILFPLIEPAGVDEGVGEAPQHDPTQF